MPGFTKTFVVLGETTTDRFGFCLVLMIFFLSASDSFADAEEEYEIDWKTEYYSPRYAQNLNNSISYFSLNIHTNSLIKVYI